MIIEAAAQVLLERDYAASSTNRIAERAGVSVGSVYQYFDNKAEIYEAALDDYFEQLVTQLNSIKIDTETSNIALSEAIIVAAYRYWPDGPAFLRKLRQVPDAHFHEKLQQTKAQIANFVRYTLMQRNEVFTVQDFDLSLKILIDAIEGIFINATADITPERLAREMSLLLNRYLMGNVSNLDP